MLHYLMGMAQATHCGHTSEDRYAVMIIFMPRCMMHRRHTVVRLCVGSSVRRFVGPSDLA